ncbi:MAG TPA: substrate-binding domain-containing protein [Tepidisphaeraceae bacterium]|jgi:tungstate transport system substrate-binding protein|nr:substrate-binding domain-containing protein [Tepidisphaeraceae bacterium]
MKFTSRVLIALMMTSVSIIAQAAPTTQPRSVRIAVIGGMNETGFWDAISHRFEQTTGIQVNAVATGNKDGIAKVFKQGGIDLIVMHTSDTIVNLVADGYAIDAQPWVKNDFIIVGPPDDPAGIKGMTDAAQALKKIAKTKSTFVIHASLGAQEVLRNILEPNEIELDPDHTTALIDDHQRKVLKIAADKKAYTLIGRIPFLNGKLPNAGMVVMVKDDLRLRRPFMVAVANPAKMGDVHLGEARMLAAFLRSDSTQAWIGTFGKGKFDDQPLFFPITESTATTQPVSAILSVVGHVPHPLFLDADSLKKLPRHSLDVKGKDGKPAHYEGVFVADVLKQAGIPLADHQMTRANLPLYVRVAAADGYAAVFSISELDDDIAVHSILLADQKDGQPLSDRDGPLRLIAPQEMQQARWVRQVQSLTVVQSN